MSESGFGLSDVRIWLTSDPLVTAVRDLNLEVRPGESVALVGESGCGKSVTAYSVLGLLPPSLSASGSLRMDGRTHDLGKRRDLESLRGNEIAMIFQDPGTSLNPVMTVGRQMEDVLRTYRYGRRDRRAAVVDLLARVGVPSPDRVAGAYPFELSGGMRQRVLIAMAVSCLPKLIIADEPTTALDTTVQAQIMELLDDLVREEGMSMLFISHDLGLVAESCQRMYVMYAGQVVETGRVDEVLETPSHPYTSALVSCLATLGQGARRLATVPGSVPAIDDLPPGCRFEPRCRHAIQPCSASVPELRPVGAGQAACIRAEELRLPSAAGLTPTEAR